MKQTNHKSDNELLLMLPEDTVQLLISLAHKTGYMERRSNHDVFFHKLRQVTEAFGKALLESEQSVSFMEAAHLSLHARMHRRPSTVADLRSYINRMCRDEDIARKALRRISIEECRRMLFAQFGHSPHSYRKAQSILHSIFHFAMRQRWCDFNPAEAILRPPVREKRIEILTLKQMHALIQSCRANHRLLPMEAPLRLMLWCGIRPAEVRRLSWTDLNVQEKVIYIEQNNSKTGGARAIPLRGGALQLLNSVPHENEKIAPNNWDRLWLSLRRESGFIHWQNDALRHTFASMHLKHFHNLPLLQEEMGHQNAHLLQTRYLNLRNLSQKSARRFFSSEEWL